MEKYDYRVKHIASLTMDGWSQTKIAQMMGITKQRVGQLLDKAERAGFAVKRRQIKLKSCATCGLEYSGSKKFCSKKCRSMAPRRFGGPASAIEVRIITCDGCGNKFSRTNKMTYIGKKLAERKGGLLKRTFCTKECYHKNGAKK